MLIENKLRPKNVVHPMRDYSRALIVDVFEILSKHFPTIERVSDYKQELIEKDLEKLFCVEAEIIVNSTVERMKNGGING